MKKIFITTLLIIFSASFAHGQTDFYPNPVIPTSIIASSSLVQNIAGPVINFIKSINRVSSFKTATGTQGPIQSLDASNEWLKSKIGFGLIDIVKGIGKAVIWVLLLAVNLVKGILSFLH